MAPCSDKFGRAKTANHGRKNIGVMDIAVRLMSNVCVFDETQGHVVDERIRVSLGDFKPITHPLG